MLIRFAVENFLSFKGTIDFLMTASADEKHHQNHLVIKKGNEILKGSFLFGANASGKSNFIKAIDFAKDIVIHGPSRIDLDRKYFRIDSDYKKHPGVFQFDLFAEEEFYSYGFAISYIDSSIQEEWLYKMGTDGKDECIFLRKKENEKTTVETELNFSDKETSDRFKVYSEDITRMGNVLFLSDIAMRASSEKEFKHFKVVRQWFDKLIVIFSDSKSLSINMMVKKDSYRKKFESMLNFFDTGIVSISQIELAIDAVFNSTPPIVVEKIKSEFMKEIKEDEHIMIKDGESFIEINLKDNELYGQKIVSNHGNDNDLFEFIDESDGTKRLFDLIPLFFLAESECVIIVDEIDRSLHTKVVLEFINMFYRITENKNSQLIVTTHDSNILNLENIRRDEIWFIERNKDQSSRLFSLSQFKSRLGEDIERDYILGRYGAIPIFNTILLEMEDSNDDK